MLLDNSDDLVHTRCINESDISQINATQTADLNNLVFCKYYNINIIFLKYICHKIFLRIVIAYETEIFYELP